MIAFVNAKINLGLRVVRRRADGYHELDTVFVPVGKTCGLAGAPGNLCDVLEVTPHDSDLFEQYGFIADCPVADNLVMRALRVLRDAGADIQPLRVCLEKHIPFGAGMGGGSADAAFMLLVANTFAHNPLSIDTLMSLALNLGADVPFFLVNEPCHAQGVGELLTPIELPQLHGKWVAVIKPEQGISTGKAFSLIKPEEPATRLPELLSRPIVTWRETVVNDFEGAMFEVYPELRSLKEHLYKEGALYASMTGSGSAFYGIYADEASARAAAESVDTPFATFLRL